MITYQYKCRACGHEFTKERRITDESGETCPECESEDTFRCIVNGDFILKGGGWYKTGGY